MAPLKRTVFNDAWLSDEAYSGIITRDKYETSAYCLVCKKSFQLSNMGVKALRSHIEGLNQQKKAKAAQRTVDIRMFTTAPGTRLSSATSAGPEGAGDPDDPAVVNTATAAATTLAAAPSRTAGGAVPPPEASSSALTQSRVTQYCLSDDTSVAEIVWCLQAVENGVSLAASGRQAALFERMFPDSAIAKKIELGASKVGYSLTFGLGPYFFEQIVNEVRQADAFVIGFDESLNKKSQKLQMDICVSYWSKKSNEVVCQYFNSAFLGHSTAKDLSNALQKHLKEFRLTKMIQVAMDGPNVNFATLRELEKDIKAVHGGDCSTFLNIGSCGLHTVNNSYKQGFKSVDWKLLEFMRSSYNIFKDVPARRSDYIRFSEEPHPLFPSKFCAVRWLENETVASNAIKTIPLLVKFIDSVETERIKIQSKSFSIVEKGLRDKLLPAKLAFFSFIALQLKPFLTEYQCTKPMIPFLYTDLSSLIKDIMGLYVKDKVIDDAFSVADIDISKEENLLPEAQVKLGNATKAELRKVTVSSNEMKQFKSDCRKILVKICQILVDKSPVSKKYRIAKYVTFCDPSLIYNNLSGSKTRLTNALQSFMSKNWLTGTTCDDIESEFKRLTSKTNFKSDCKNYVRNDQRIDHFWRLHLEGQETYKNLFAFVKQVLILSHGQAFVERGFSVNKNLIVENQLAHSLVAQRHVYDGLKAAGGVKSFEVTKKMISAFRLARRNHKEALEKQANESREDRAKSAEKRAMVEKLAELKAKKAKISSEKAAEMNAIDDQIADMLTNIGK